MRYAQSTLFIAPISSILQDRPVKLGDRVKAGQVLGRLYDQELRATIALNAAEADTDLYIRISKIDYNQALLILEHTERLNQQQHVSQENLSKDRYAVQKAALAIEEATHRRDLAVINRRHAEAEAHAREFVSPHDGVVVETYKNAGESVRFTEPILKVVNPGRLKVTGSLNLIDAWRVRAGQDVRVIPESAGIAITSEEFLGRVSFVDNQIDPDTQTCRVVAEVADRNELLRSGLEVRMEIQPPRLTGFDLGQM